MSNIDNLIDEFYKGAEQVNSNLSFNESKAKNLPRICQEIFDYAILSTTRVNTCQFSNCMFIFCEVVKISNSIQLLSQDLKRIYYTKLLNKVISHINNIDITQQLASQEYKNGLVNITAYLMTSHRTNADPTNVSAANTKVANGDVNDNAIPRLDFHCHLYHILAQVATQDQDCKQCFLESLAINSILSLPFLYNDSLTRVVAILSEDKDLCQALTNFKPDKLNTPADEDDDLTISDDEDLDVNVDANANVDVNVNLNNTSINNKASSNFWGAWDFESWFFYRVYALKDDENEAFYNMVDICCNIFQHCPQFELLDWVVSHLLKCSYFDHLVKSELKWDYVIPLLTTTSTEIKAVKSPSIIIDKDYPLHVALLLELAVNMLIYQDCNNCGHFRESVRQDTIEIIKALLPINSNNLDINNPYSKLWSLFGKQLANIDLKTCENFIELLD